MLNELRKRVQKAGHPPGTPIYTGEKYVAEPHLNVVTYSAGHLEEKNGTKLEECLPASAFPGMTWINVMGLSNTDLIHQLAERYHLHPLTVEDILNVGQRPKIEEFDHYLFITLKTLLWHKENNHFTTEQFSLVIGKNFVLSFQEQQNTLFNGVYARLRAGSTQQLRQQGSDYLAYRLIDTIVDQYFIVLEKLGDMIEQLEERIISEPTPHNARSIYHVKRQALLLRKSIWPMREVINHLLQADEAFITSFTRLYIRDLYDHSVQAIDTIETFRDMLASILDIYLSSLSNRMNEIMKVLTIIATIFIPITFIASLFGMNFKYMPELNWHFGYYLTLGVMLLITLVMLLYFRRKKWI